MYGTVFNFNVKPGHQVELLNILKISERTPDGMVAWFLMTPDTKSEWIGVAVFESKEAHIANANSPEQHKLYLQIMEYLESEPTWTDGTYVIGEIT